MRALVSLVLVSTLCVAHADPRVVGDDACPRYAVDIAGFATCDGARVAAAGGVDLAPALLPEAAVPVAKRSFSGLYVDARHAEQLKHDYPQAVVLIDVRSRLEVGLVGQPAGVDVHVPLLETAMPLRWDDDIGGWAMTRNPSFAAEAAARLDQLGITRDTPLLVLCRSGERSARAADELAALGFKQTISVIDGFEGDFGADGKRTVNGWKNAGLPWTGRPIASLVYGAR